MDKRTYYIMLICLAFAWFALIFNVGTEAFLELPFGLTIGGDVAAIIPTIILANFIYKQYTKSKKQN